MLRTILWIGIVVSVVFFYVQSSKFKKAGVADIEDYEYATTSNEARQILKSWEDVNLVRTVKTTIHYDFAFIVIYLLLMIDCFNDQVTQEQNRILNNLLRLSIALAVVVALLDLSENFILLYNLKNPLNHINSFWITLVKFTMAYGIVGLWIISNVKTRIGRRAKSRVSV